MAWNGSSGASPKTPEKSAPKMARGVLAGLLVVIVAAVVAVMMLRESTPENKTAEAVEPKSIPLVTPTITINEESPKPVAPKKKEFWEVSNTETNGFSEGMQRKWVHMHYPPACYTNTSALTYTPPNYAIFRHPSENRIASYLTIANGQTMVGTPVFGPSFEKDFLKSCEEPIIISKDDSDETKALKKLMTEVKIELRQRMADGEKLEDILMETHREVQKLALVRSDIEKVVDEQLREAQSQADVDVIMDAANKMLEARGIAPVSLNPILRRNIESRFINAN